MTIYPEFRVGKSLRLKISHAGNRYFVTLPIKVDPDQWEDGRVKNHPKATAYNKLLRSKIQSVEDTFLNSLSVSEDPAYLKRVLAGSETSQSAIPTFKEFCDEIIGTRDLDGTLVGKLSEGRIRQLRCTVGKIDAYHPGLLFSEVDHLWMQRFENYLRAEGLAQNTLNAQMAKTISLLSKAADHRYINRQVWARYQRPSYIQNIPVSLTEEELDNFEKQVFVIVNPAIKMSGMYYLLACYTGFRMSDCKRFDPETHLLPDSVVLRAKKNNEIVSVPRHDHLEPVIQYCKEHKLSLSEKEVRENVKKIATVAGIRKDVVFHSGRHTFAMQLLRKGFSVEQVAHYLGDSPEVAKVYARIGNLPLDARMKEAFKKQP